MLADKNNPVRCSRLHWFTKCTMRVYLGMLITDDDGLGGPAAQTGNLAHAGIAAFHHDTGTVLQRRKAAWDAIAANAAKFPLAEENEVRLLLTPYMNDPRNINADIVEMDVFCEDSGKITRKRLIEHKVRFTLPAHPMDETGEDIYVEGSFDQIRLFAGVPKVCDYKSGKKTGWEMIHDHAIQIAAYCYGARQIGVKDCQPGPIIRGMGYRTREANEQSIASGDFPGVLFNAPFRYHDIEAILEGVRLNIGLVRMGIVNYGPGPHCTFCDFQGLSGCIRTFNESQKG